MAKARSIGGIYAELTLKDKMSKGIASARKSLNSFGSAALKSAAIAGGAFSVAMIAGAKHTLAMTDGDETGDYTPFWAERDYNPDAGNVQASVFVVHGLQDDNVMPDHFSKWWDALPAGVAKKLWLTRTGP